MDARPGEKKCEEISKRGRASNVRTGVRLPRDGNAEFIVEELFYGEQLRVLNSGAPPRHSTCEDESGREA